MIRIEGDGVVLRAFRPEEFDAAWQARLASTTTVGAPNHDALRRRHEQSGTWQDGRLDLGVEHDGELVGEVGVRSNLGLMPPGVCELGIELWADRRGAGIGTATIALFTAWLHEQGFPRVQGGTDVDNGPMRRVFEKAGYENEGVMRAFMPADGARADFVLYAHVG